MKKGLIYGGGAVVVIVVIAVALVIFRAGDVIKAVVEELGPQMTKSEVTLEKVDLSLSSIDRKSREFQDAARLQT